MLGKFACLQFQDTHSSGPLSGTSFATLICFQKGHGTGWHSLFIDACFHPSVPFRRCFCMGSPVCLPPDALLAVLPLFLGTLVVSHLQRIQSPTWMNHEFTVTLLSNFLLANPKKRRLTLTFLLPVYESSHSLPVPSRSIFTSKLTVVSPHVSQWISHPHRRQVRHELRTLPAIAARAPVVPGSGNEVLRSTSCV